MDTNIKNINSTNSLEELKDILERRYAYYHYEIEGMANPVNIVEHSIRLEEISYVLGCIEAIKLVDKNNTEEL